MGDVILYKEDVDRLNFLLKNLITDAKILSALLITKDTRVLACQGSLVTDDPGALAALLVGSFASTQAIATLIGESEFDTMTHLGKSKNVVISLINDETILASIFDNNTTSDMITQVVWRHTAGLRKALAAIGGNTADGLFDGPDMTSPDENDDFEKRTDALVKSMETEQPPPIVEQAPLQKQPLYAKDTRQRQDTEHEIAEASRRKRAPLAPAASGSAAEIKRPPDTQVLVSESSVSSKDYDVYSLNQAPVSAPLHPANASREKKTTPTPDSGKGEAVYTSMNYLQTKAREGALYYHHDKAFFKKFFKTSSKKKS